MTTLSIIASLVLGWNAAPLQDGAKAGATKQDSKSEAKAERLASGSKAPALEVAEFLKGDAVTEFKAGQTYVVEFWATWCGPCVKAFPHLSELQAKHGDKVKVIGVNIWERPYDEETLAKVKEFVKTQADKMSYTVAYGGPDAKADTAWMKAAGRNGIPSAFIVDGTGTVAWIGHPATMDPVLEKVIAGEWNTAEAKKLEDAEAKDMEAARAQQKSRVALLKARVAARESDDWTPFLKAVDELIASSKEPASTNFRMMKFQTLIGEANQPEAGYAIGEELIVTGKDDPMVLNEIAWFSVQDDSITKRNLDFCLKAANAANDAAKGADGAILDTLARVYWERGENAKAVELQEKAVKLADGTPMAAEMKETLESYKKGK